MNWNSAAEFFAMGGYAVYVWGAYTAAAACLLLEPLLVAGRVRKARRAASLRRHHEVGAAQPMGFR